MSDGTSALGDYVRGSSSPRCQLYSQLQSARIRCHPCFPLGGSACSHWGMPNLHYLRSPICRQFVSIKQSIDDEFKERMGPLFCFFTDISTPLPGQGHLLTHSPGKKQLPGYMVREQLRRSWRNRVDGENLRSGFHGENCTRYWIPFSPCTVVRLFCWHPMCSHKSARSG